MITKPHHIITHNGREYSPRQIGELIGRTVTTIRDRVKEGYSGDEIVAIYTTNKGLCPLCGVRVGGSRTLYCHECSPRTQMRDCIHCGNEYKPNRNQRYCSVHCRQTITAEKRWADSKIQRDTWCLKTIDRRVVPCKHYHNWLAEESLYCCCQTEKDCPGYEPGKPSNITGGLCHADK